MSYIHSGFKLNMSPRVSVYPQEWLDLDKQAEPLEERLHYLRTMDYNTCKPHPFLEEIRQLRVTLSKIDSQMQKILYAANPEYADYWFN